jgi:hypothetical protein
MCDHCDHTFEHPRYRLETALAALHLNHSPVGVEANQILGTIIEIDCHFERYDPEISRVQAVLSALQEQRRSLAQFQEFCRSILSPIRKLPPEILQSIFLAGMGEKPDVIPVAGQVCRYWRDVVLGTPKLWSIISIGRTRFTLRERYHELASLFLQRSTIKPLSVFIREPVDARLVKLLVGHAKRWQTLCLSITNRGFYSSDLGLDVLDLGALEKFEVTEEIADFFDTGTPITISQNAPKLREVVLKSPLDHWSLPWDQLTRIQYNVRAAGDGLRIFQLCPRLEECSLDKMKVAMSGDSPTLRPSHKLRFLRLATDTTTPTDAPELIFNTFFSRLNTSNLVSLELICQWSARDLTGFLSRSECKLENLRLGTGYMKYENIVPVLENLPLLKTLVLDADIGTSRQLQNRVITDKLLRRFIFYPDSDSLLPSLEHLSLKTSVNFEDQVLLDVIESRWVPWVTELYGVRVSRLTSVDLHFCGKKETLAPSTIEELRVLHSAGLRISLQQGNKTVPLVAVSPDN